MKATEYAQALYEATRGKNEEEVDNMLQNLFRILKKSGHTKLLKSIESELEKIVNRKGCSDELHVRVAHESDVEKFSAQIERDAKELKADTLKRKIVVDKTLVGGYELRGHGTRIDNTYKRSLLSLYNNLITN